MNRYLCVGALAAAVLALAFPQSGFAQQNGLSISTYTEISETRISSTLYYYTFVGTLTNTGGAATNVTATLSSQVTNITLVPGQGSLFFPTVPAGSPNSPSSVNSSNTFTIKVDRSQTFSWSGVTWSFNNPVANPGTNQTVPVQTTVALNGGGSTNPSGIGSLTYSWAFQLLPSGSTATISNANNVLASFKADMVGNYIVALTVTNATTNQSDTNIITISTTDVAPTANAGTGQTVTLNQTVQLNGTGSTDLDGKPLTYQWSFVSKPGNSNASFSPNAQSSTPTFVADVAGGTWIVGLVVNDGFLNSPQSTVTITSGNTPPTAVATANGNNPATVNVNGLVQLDGSKSTDVNSNQLSYLWSLNTSGAAGSKATLSAFNIVNPYFTADVPGTYVAQLIVNDGVTNSTAATVTISTNAVMAPTANAGQPQTVIVGSPVQLTGSGTDPQGLPLTYTWTLPTLPTGSNAGASFPSHQQNPTFVPDLPGTYGPQLVINNGYVNSSPSTVMITSNSVAPVAVPTTTTPSVIVGQLVSLSGASSTDPNNFQIVSYSWSLSVPPTSNAKLSNATSEFPTFTPDVAGTYVAQLTVSDPYLSSVPVTLPISAGAYTITLTPNPLNLASTAQSLTVTLSPGAGSTPVTVNLTGFDNTVISLPSSVQIAANSSSANVTVTPIASTGSTSITASATPYTSATVPVNVTLPTFNITFAGGATSVALNHNITGTITLASPAPQFGTTVFLVDVLDYDVGIPGEVTFNPNSVFIPSGQTTGTFVMTGVQTGNIKIRATSPGYAFYPTIVYLVNILGNVSLPTNLSVPASGQAVNLNVQLSAPAPADGVTITLQSNNTSVLTVSPTTVTVNPGQTTPTVTPKVTGVAIGSTTITANANGYNSDTETVNSTATLSFSPSSITVAAGGQQTFNVNLSAPAPQPSGVPISLSSNSSNATVTALVNIPAGQTTTTATITGVTVGPATITATTNNQLIISSGASLSVTVGSLTLPCSSVTSGDVNVPFTSGVTASGGTTPYTYTIATGSLPSGLSLNSSTGAITGTPTQAGTFTIKVTDATGATATSSCTFTINGPLTLPCPTTTSGDVNTAFSSAVTASGGTAPYTYSVVGTLPTGLSLNSSTGAITGTPTQPGTFTIKVTDAAGATASTPCSFTINSQLTLPCPTTTLGDVNSAFSSTVTASGGTAPYTYTIATGSLPNGLSLNSSTGAITGTPTQAGTFTIKVTDAAGATASTPCSFTINSQLTLPCPTNTSGDVNTAFSSTVTASGGSGPYTYTIATGSLPNGLSLNSSTGAITGTPTQAGTFTIKVTDAASASATSSCTFTINLQMTVFCPSTTAGDQGIPFSSSVGVSGGSAPYSYTVVNGTLPTGLTISSTGAITGTPTSAGTFQIKVTDAAGATATAPCQFTIFGPLTLPCPATTSGTVNVSFNSQVSASGGSGSYIYSVTGGTLPSGLSLNPATGALSGTPTVTGTFQILVTDTAGGTATSCQFTIASAPLQITTSSLPTGTVNIQYVASVNVTGGATPYTWSLGTAPSWLTIGSTTGILSGMPSGTGSFPVQVNVHDSTQGTQQTTSITYTLMITGGALQFTTTSLPNATVGVFYTQSVGVSGGTPPYNTWQTNLSQVSWLKFSANGSACNTSGPTLCGTPSLSDQGATTFNISVQDSSTNPQSVSESLTVTVQTASTGNTMTLTGGSGNSASFMVGQYLEVPLTITFSPMPTSNTTVTLTYTAPNGGAITFSEFPAPNGNNPPAASNTLQFSLTPEPSVFVYVQGTAVGGPITITATSPTYGTATATVTVGHSGFALQSPNGIGAGFSTYQNLSTLLTLNPVLLNSQNAVVETEQVSYSQTFSVPVVVSPSTPYGTVSPSTVTFAPGTGSLQGGNGGPTFTGSGSSSGLATISVTQPLGFNFITPVPGGSVTANVQASALVPPTNSNGLLIVGSNLQIPVSFTLSGAASANTSFSIASQSSSLQFSNTENGAGSSTITVSVQKGFSSSQTFWVRAYGAPGNPQYTITGGTFGTVTLTVTLVPSELVLGTPGGTNANFSFTVGTTAQANINVYTAANTGSGYILEEVAADQSLSINVVSGTTSVGTISNSPVPIAGGSNGGGSALTFFTASAINTGNTLITASSAGFSPSGNAIQSGSVTATVTPCVLNINNNAVVGQFLEAAAGATLSFGCSAPPGGLPITLSVPAQYQGAMALSATPTGQGSSSITVTIPQGQSGAVYYIYGLGTGMSTGEGASPASVTYSANITNPSYIVGGTGTDTVFLAPSGVIISGPAGIGDQSDSVFGNQTLTMTVQLDVLSTDGAFTPNALLTEPLAGNTPLSVTLTNNGSSSGISTAGSLSPEPVIIQPGTPSSTVVFTPTTANQTATIQVLQPATFQGTVNDLQLNFFTFLNVTQVQVSTH